MTLQARTTELTRRRPALPAGACRPDSARFSARSPSPFGRRWFMSASARNILHLTEGQGSNGDMSDLVPPLTGLPLGGAARDGPGARPTTPRSLDDPPLSHRSVYDAVMDV